MQSQDGTAESSGWPSRPFVGRGTRCRAARLGHGTGLRLTLRALSRRQPCRLQDSGTLLWSAASLPTPSWSSAPSPFSQELLHLLCFGWLPRAALGPHCCQALCPSSRPVFASCVHTSSIPWPYFGIWRLYTTVCKGSCVRMTLEFYKL